MGQTRRAFTREFKQEAVKLVTAGGHPTAQVARDLGVAPNQLRRWKQQNPDKVRKQRARHPHYVRDWRRRNPEKVQTYKRRGL